MSRDLRTWIDQLEAEGELKRIKAKVNWDGEIAEIQRRVLTRQGPALLFENIKGHEKTWCTRLFANGLGTPGRVAMMFNAPRGTPFRDLVQLARKRFKSPVEPEVVKTGPVKENILKGPKVDLNQMPVPKWHELDGARYISTWCATITADPDTGVLNAGVYRGGIRGRDRISFLMNMATNWGNHFERYSARGQAMPVALVIGWDPSMAFTAGVPVHVSEYGLMGAVRQAPVPLVKCENSDLLVPATAEIVLEGTISPDPNDWDVEGPYGESTGYYDRARKRPTARIECISHRNEPIFRGAISESGPMIRLAYAALAWNTLEQQDIAGIVDIECGTFTVVKIHKTYQGQARHVAAALWGSRTGIIQYKVVVVVDDERDWDIHDPGQVNRAISFNTDATRGVVTYPMQVGPPTDPALSMEARDEQEQGQALQDRLLIDATVDWTTHPRREEWGWRRISPDANKASPAMSKLVSDRWQEYGL